jgi:predicted acyltransferase
MKPYLSVSWNLLPNQISVLIFSDAAAIPLNKQLYTLSYVCVTSGAAALVFSAFYIMVYFFWTSISLLKILAIFHISHFG